MQTPSRLALLFAAAALLGFLFFDHIQFFTAFPPAVRALYFLFIAGVVAVLGAALLVPMPSWSATIEVWCMTIAVLAGTAILYILWNFDLDDKWGYYRLARSVLSTGEPLWNVSEGHAVAASWIWPYLVAPGAIGNNPDAWDLFSKCVGIACTAGASIISWISIRDAVLRTLTTTAIILFAPGLLWSLSGLDTPLAVLWTLGTVAIYLRWGPTSLLFWLLAGAMMLVRPDGILLGIGVFVAQFLRTPKDIKAHFFRGLAFSAPIVLFLARNYVASGVMMPLVFYVKGWNCVYCGHDGLLSQLLSGSLQTLSAIFASAPIVALISVGLALLYTWVRDRGWRSSATAQGRSVDLMIGLLVYLAYPVIGGYQHMGFAFRYFIPPLMGIVIVLAYYFSEKLSAPGSANIDRIALLRKYAPALVVVAAFQGLAESTHIRFFDMAMTQSPRQDKFSLDSYRSYLRSWRQAGMDLRPVVTPDTRLFLIQGMVTGSLTDGYMIDQFYFPSNRSSVPEIRNCFPKPNDPQYCMRLYDYVFTFTDPSTWPPGFEPIGKYDTIAILKNTKRHSSDSNDGASGANAEQ